MTIVNGSTSWEGRICGLKTIILKTENSKLISIGHKHIKKLLVFARDQTRIKMLGTNIEKKMVMK